MDIAQIIEMLMALPYIVGQALSIGVIGSHAVLTAISEMLTKIV